SAPPHVHPESDAIPVPAPVPTPAPVPHPVMAGPRDWPQASPRTCLVPAIHDFADVAEESKSWMTGTSPVMTGETTGTSGVMAEAEPADDTAPASSVESAEQSRADPSPSLRGAQRRSNPEPRERCLSRGPGLLRSARNDGVSEPTTDGPARDRDDDAHAAEPSEPPAEAAPAPSEPTAEAVPADAPAPAPAIPPAPPEPAPAPVRIALLPYPPGDTTIIK